jgi:hypothetical protein
MRRVTPRMTASGHLGLVRVARPTPPYKPPAVRGFALCGCSGLAVDILANNTVGWGEERTPTQCRTFNVGVHKFTPTCGSSVWGRDTPGKTSAILYNANYADNGVRKAAPAYSHNPQHYVTWRGFALTTRTMRLPSFGSIL